MTLRTDMTERRLYHHLHHIGCTKYRIMHRFRHISYEKTTTNIYYHTRYDKFELTIDIRFLREVETSFGLSLRSSGINTSDVAIDTKLHNASNSFGFICCD